MNKQLQFIKSSFGLCVKSVAEFLHRLFADARNFRDAVTARIRRVAIFSRRGNSSLVRRFQILLLTWGVAVYVIAVAGFWLLSTSVIQNTFQLQAERWISKLDELSIPLYVSQDIKEFSTIESYIQNFSEISYVRFYNGDGETVLAQYTAENVVLPDAGGFDAAKFIELSKNRRRDGNPLRSNFVSDESLMRMVVPVSIVSMQADEMLDFDMDGERGESVAIIGYIDLGLDFGEYQESLARHILSGSVLISFIFLIAAIVGRNLIRNALKPLLDLHEPLKKLAQGETDVWVNRGGDEEIVAISNALTTTINAIKGRDEELRRLADYDALTGLINKRSFDAILEKERERVIAERDVSALFFIDLDQFKYVNDTLGHASGDRLLMQIAELLSNRMRSDDVVCRLGGDEFAVLARSVDGDGASEIAASIVKCMYDFLFIEQGKTFNIYCSVGVALIEDDKSSAEEIFSNADMACYSAKSQGRNRYHFYEATAVDQDKLDIGWSHRITNALANDKFTLHYQPIVALEKNSIPNYEVLLRMVDDDGELVPPNLFIPVAERFGLATEIDYWVIKRAMTVLEGLNREGKRLRFYVNLSGQLFIDPEFVERVVAMLEATDIDANQIVFELTERVAVGNIHQACHKMETLIEHGFEFAIDDFGSGFSSFSYLKHMPVKIVKIEGEFVERIIDDEVDRAMVRSMVDIAKACGKQVVAEYVCDEDTLEMLKSFGIDYAQGFYIAEPAAQPASFNGAVDIPDNVTQMKM